MEYKKILLDENNKMNLIGKSTIDDFDQRHILDCLQIINHMPNKDKQVMDIGTGAGLPGVLLSIMGYQNLHLVEKSPKKSAFLESCKVHLGLNYKIYTKPISEISGLNIDYITARAFAPIEKIIHFTKNIIHKKTIYVLLKGKSYLSELKFINSEKYRWQSYPSITSNESKIIVMGLK
jgi:16S rRNA (guanine(527)-N(7))-methyltransferase RsmG